MLVEFRFQNFKSFRDPQTLSLVASSDRKTLVDNIMGSKAMGKKKLVRRVPGVGQIKKWVASAKKLKRVISY